MANGQGPSLINPNPVSCPVLNAAVGTPQGPAFAMSPCIMTGCVWFNRLSNQCRIVTIDEKLATLIQKLSALEVSNAKR